MVPESARVRGSFRNAFLKKYLGKGGEGVYDQRRLEELTPFNKIQNHSTLLDVALKKATDQINLK